METTSTNRIPTNTKEALILFYNKILATDGQRFTVRDAYIFIEQYNYGVNEESVSRNIRKLKAAKKINYAVVNKNQGIYQALPAEAQGSGN